MSSLESLGRSAAAYFPQSSRQQRRRGLMGNQLFDLRDPTVWSPALPYHCIRRHSTFSSSVDTTIGCGATTAAITMLLSVISRRTYLSLYKRKSPGGRQSRRPTQWHRLHKSFDSMTTEVIASPCTRHSHRVNLTIGCGTATAAITILLRLETSHVKYLSAGYLPAPHVPTNGSGGR